MGEAVGAVLGYATGIAVSPVPVAAVILMLMSGRARTNGPTFALAWVLGIAGVSTVMVLLPGLETADRTPSMAAGWVKLGLGVLLLVASARQWRTRPGPGDEPDVPGWMAHIDDLGPAQAFGLGLLLSAANPKNLVLAVAAGATIAGIDLSGGEAAGAIGLFTLVAGVSVLAPVIAHQVAGDRLAAPLDRVKESLLRNNQTVMVVLFVVFGMSLIGDGLEILSA